MTSVFLGVVIARFLEVKVMTYPEIMEQWKAVNRRLWPYFLMPLAFLIVWDEIASWGQVPAILPWAGLITSVALSCWVYGDLTDELVAVSGKADQFKMELLIEDLGSNANDMPLMRVTSDQEMGNLRYPSRLVFVIKGVPYPVTYDWRKRSFSRYKWPILPFSLDNAILRSKAKT